MFSSFSESFGNGRRYYVIKTPTELPPTLQVWYSSDQGNTVNFNATLADGDNLSQWKDKSGLSHNLNQSGNTSVKPNWYQNIQNGLGGVLFNGTSESLNINPVAWLANAGSGLTGVSMYAVIKNSSLSGIRPVTGADIDGSKIYYDGSNWAIKIAGAVGTSTVTGDTSKFHVVSMIYDGTQSTNAARARFRYDGAEQNLTYTGTVGANTDGSIGYFYVGEDGLGNYFSGYISEMMLFSRTNSMSEISAIEGYLKLKWAI